MNCPDQHLGRTRSRHTSSISRRTYVAPQSYGEREPDTIFAIYVFKIARRCGEIYR